MLRLLRANKYALFLAVWAAILAGYHGFPALLPTYSDSLYALLLHLIYLGYPTIVVAALAPRGRLVRTAAAASAGLALVPLTQSLSLIPDETHPGWAVAAMLAWFSWVYVLAAGARTVTESETRTGPLATVGAFAAFLLLPLGGIVLLQGRVQAVAAQKHAA